MSIGSYYTEYVKDMAKARKELEITPCVRISIERKDRNTGQMVRLFLYDLPRALYERWMWVIDWRIAKFKCMYPRDSVRAYHSFYDGRSGLDLGWGSLLSELASAKAQVTKIERKIDQYIADQKRNNLFFDESNDEFLLKARLKLEDKRTKVAEIENKVKSKVDDHGTI